MSDLPRRAVTRTAKLATLPVGLAGRTALGLGKRLGGRPAEMVAAGDPAAHGRADLQGSWRAQGRRDEVRPGAVDLRGRPAAGDRRALPGYPDQAAGIRAAAAGAAPCTRSSPRTSARTGGERSPSSTTSRPPLPPSGRCTAPSGRTAARSPSRSSIRAPGKALHQRLQPAEPGGRLFAVLMPGLDVKPLLAELRARVAEELDYRLEAVSQHAFAGRLCRRPGHLRPACGRRHRPRARHRMDGRHPARQDHQRWHAGGARPRRAPVRPLPVLRARPGSGLLHADPHPGNFRLLADGRLGVLDFGAVDRLPGGFPPFFGRLLRLVHDAATSRTCERELRENGFLREGISIDLEALRAFLAPLAEPSQVETFKFSREWLRNEAARVTDRAPPTLRGGSTCRPLTCLSTVSNGRDGGAVPARMRGPVPGRNAPVDARICGAAGASAGPGEAPGCRVGSAGGLAASSLSPCSTAIGMHHRSRQGTCQRQDARSPGASLTAPKTPKIPCPRLSRGHGIGETGGRAMSPRSGVGVQGQLRAQPHGVALRAGQIPLRPLSPARRPAQGTQPPGLAKLLGHLLHPAMSLHGDLVIVIHPAHHRSGPVWSWPRSGLDCSRLWPDGLRPASQVRQLRRSSAGDRAASCAARSRRAGTARRPRRPRARCGQPHRTGRRSAPGSPGTAPSRTPRPVATQRRTAPDRLCTAGAARRAARKWFPGSLPPELSPDLALLAGKRARYRSAWRPVPAVAELRPALRPAPSW